MPDIIRIDDKVAKHAGGRPIKFPDPDILSAQIDSYFDSCYEDRVIKDKKGEPIIVNGEPYIERVLVSPPCITGLTLYLDCDYGTLENYEGDRLPDGIPRSKALEYFRIIKRARKRCENFAEMQLFNGGNPAGAIFNLKNNYGWKDKVETENNTKITLDINLPDNVKKLSK